MFGRLSSSLMVLGAAALLTAACAETQVLDSSQLGGQPGAGDLGKADASIDAIFLDFEFAGELVTGSSWNPEKQIETQLLFTIGQLNGDNSLGRLDKVVLTDVETRETDEGTLIAYKATIPVAWGKRDDVPTGYTLLLPRDTSHAGQEAFAQKYGHDCVDWAAHDVDAGTMWYYYRPAAHGCELADGDVVRLEANVSVSAINTTGKYPEYHEIWKDDRLEVVAVFGKFEHGATSNYDAGISSYNEFISELRGDLSAFELVTTPAELPSSPGVEVPDVTLEATLPDGKTVRVVVLLVDGVQSPGPHFDERYEDLSRAADLIAYSGHSGLGANIRALARKGSWTTGQYAVVFMNGCDTYAYVDSELADAHTAVNDDDPNGTKYLDIVTNAMPAPASQSPGNTLALTNALLSWETPMTYEAIFAKFNRSQVVLVSGEEDNVYYPGYGEGDDPAPFEGLDESGTIAADEEAHVATAVVAAGEYAVTLSGTGDADLYVRAGEAPTTELYDCRPYLEGSDETCRLELAAPATIHVMVRGWAPSSDWSLQIR